ncbi:hypothetical protein HY312_02640, partial [Candidatus Saccharibacteria bacterium]|nr:hypothetical protein [Candidatus Saccharibacteria bacterium]
MNYSVWGRRNTVEAILPQIDTYFYGEQGQVLAVDDHQSFREVAKLQQDIYEDEKKLLRKYSHEKSNDFLVSETAARDYLATLGFEGLPPIYLVDD